MTKICFKCGERKPITDFYAHKHMADGRLNKCIDCAKRDSSKRYTIKIEDPKWLAAERERCRIKQANYRRPGLDKKYPEIQIKWAKNNKDKKRAQGLANKAQRSGKIKRKTACENCGAKGVRLEKHHPDYTKPLLVQFLCCPCHGLTRRK